MTGNPEVIAFCTQKSGLLQVRLEVPLTSFCCNYDAKLGSSVGGIVRVADKLSGTPQGSLFRLNECIGDFALVDMKWKSPSSITTMAAQRNITTGSALFCGS